MSSHTKRGIIWAIIFMVIAGSLELFFANSENWLYEFCTTKAYGWPAPWKVEYCLCEKEQVVYPAGSVFVNIGFVLASGVFGFIITVGIGMLRRRIIDSE